MLDLVIRDGTIVDGQGAFRGSLAVSGSRIAARFAAGADVPPARMVIDAGGLLVLPGVVDPHVHFYGEGIGGYSRLAVMGGVTTFIGMMRGRPEQRLADVVGEHRRDGAAASLIDFSFHVVLYDRDGVIDEIAPIAEQGFCSFKVFLAYKRRGMMASETFLFAAMQEIERAGGIVLVHAEDGELIDRLEQAAMAAGRTAWADYAPTRPPEAEASAIGVVALASAATGCPAYIVHVSSRAGLAAVEAARRRGVPLCAETCPQYILMDEAAVRELGPLAVIAPPLRTARDRAALATAVMTGAINAIGSDHASYAVAAKQQGNDNIFASPFGMPGAPTLFPAMYTWALEHGVPLPVLVRAMAETPARLFGLAHRKGTLSPGADADIIVLHPSARRTVDAEALWPNVCPNPLAGQSLAGWPEMTISRGEIVWRGGNVTASAGRGQLVEQKRGKVGP